MCKHYSKGSTSSLTNSGSMSRPLQVVDSEFKPFCTNKILENIHHPKYDINYEIYPDLDKIDGLLNTKVHHHDENHHHHHHPKHDVDYEVNPDIDEMDGILHTTVHHHVYSHVDNHPNIKTQMFQRRLQALRATDVNIKSTGEKVNPWTYPKHHQEITGRPDAFLGGCEIRLHESPRRSPNKGTISLSSSSPIQRLMNRYENEIQGNIAMLNESESTDKNVQKTIVIRDLNDRAAHNDVMSISQLQHSNDKLHPDPIPIGCHPVKDSPFLKMEPLHMSN